MTGLFFGSLDSPVGVVGVVAGPDGLRRLGWKMTPGQASAAPDASVELVLAQLREYFAGERTDFDLPLDLPQFEPTTSAILMTLYETVGYGETVTYAELARRSGTGVHARALGSIMGANPIPLVIPCHRVVASHGLGGYSGGDPGQGIATKRWLLETEGALPPTLL